MQTSSDLALYLVFWVATVTVVVWNRWRKGRRGTGLVFSYLATLWLNYWVGASLYLIPWHDYHDPNLVEAGFLQSTYGIVAFAFGSIVLSPLVMKFFRIAKERAGSYALHQELPKAYLVIGVVSFLLLSTPLGSMPTFNALIAVGQQLFVVGLCLLCWQAWLDKDVKAFGIWFGVTLLLPFITVVTRGFIGYGMASTLVVLTFVASVVRLRLMPIVVTGLILGYLGLSVYVSYMRDRNEIREVVWGGEALESRIDRVLETIDTLEWFNPMNEHHLQRVDKRLNQNVFVGMVVDRLSDTGEYASGATLWQALLALIPRIVWQDKPIAAGSGDLVSEYTGLRFAEGTSVGIGQVMEFYINFGTAGVIGFFLLMGIAVTLIDDLAEQRLLQGHWQGFALWFLTGISFLQVGGSLVEIASSAGASIVLALSVNKFLLYRFQKKHTHESAENEVQTL